MKKQTILLLGCICITLFTNCEQPKKATNNLQITTEDHIKRGEYLVTIMDCNICHSPKKMTDQGPVLDMEKMLSGFPGDATLPETPISGNWILFYPDFTASVGPWGTSFSANITPDETGIGNWTFEQFKRSITAGKSKGLENGRPLLPPMPWESFRSLTDNDIKAIFEYLKSIPPVKNIVPSPIPPKEI